MEDSWRSAVSLLAATSNEKQKLAKAYGDLLRDLFGRDLWSPTSAAGRMFPWRLVSEARKNLQSDFNSPGLYLFGAGRCPLLIGKTEGSLWRRLRGRYLRGPKSQCNLAATYAPLLIEHGVDGFPEEIRTWYRKRFGGSTVRLSHAVAFAKIGIESIWIALLPVGAPGISGELELRLIPIAYEWNLQHGCSPLLNRQHIS